MVATKYNLVNKRDICMINLDKEMCNSKHRCKWAHDSCLYKIDKKNLITFINKIVEEFVKDEN